jgi:uridine kinase
LKRLHGEQLFDDPEMIDYELLTECIDTLKLQNKPFMGPKYNRKNQTREDGVNEIEPHQVIIVSGALIFNDAKLREHLDLRIYVDADDDVRLSRTVLKNDVKPEGEK